MKQGIVVESNAEYHASKEYVSKSMLAKMAVCPKYFKWCLENEEKETKALTIGSAFHKLVLEPQEFGKEFVVMPQIDRRTKAGREVYEEFLKAAEGRRVVTQEQYDIIVEMANEILCNENATILTEGIVETSMYGTDEVTGELIKTRPDCYQIIDGKLLISDLKSCRSALTENFTRDCFKLGYDLQAYMYCYNASRVLNIPMEDISFYFVAVEGTAPYLINIFKVTDEMFKRGEMLYRKYMGMYHEAKTTDNWWGLNGKRNLINELTLPPYLLIKGEDEDE